jgi:hypothetical protein
MAHLTWRWNIQARIAHDQHGIASVPAIPDARVDAGQQATLGVQILTLRCRDVNVDASAG